jgi:hypothetical protein
MRGLQLQPDHAGIRKALREMGIRQKRALPFLSRDNQLNIMLGKMRRRS